MLIRHRLLAAVVALSILAIVPLMFARTAVPAPSPLRPVEPVRLDSDGEPLPPGALARAGTLRFRHGGDVGQIAFTADGRTVYTAGAMYGNGPPEKIARAWSVPDGKELRRFGGDDVLTAVAVSPNGKLVATGENANVVRIWDASTGQEVRRLTATLPETNPNQGEVPRYVMALRFAADGKAIVATYVQAPVAVLWDVSTGAERQRWTGEDAYPTNLSGDGARLAAVGTGVHVVDVATGLEVQTVQLATNPNNQEQVMAVALNADGSILATVTDDKTIRFWDVATGRKRRQATLPGYATALAFSGDGAALAAFCPDVDGVGAVVLIDAKTGKELRRLEGPIRGIHVLVFTPDGKSLATGGVDHTLRLWDTATGKELPSPAGHPGGITTISLTRDGRRLATCSDNDRIIRIWESATGREVRQIVGHPAGVDEVTFSPDGKLLASAAWDDAVYIWEVATGRLVHKLEDHAALGAYLRFADDSKTLATCGRANAVGLWDCTTGKLIRELPAPPNGLSAFGPFHDGRLLAFEAPDPNVEANPIITLWDVTANYPMRRFEGHQGIVNSAVLSADGRMVASRGSDGTIRVWEVATGGERRRFQEPGPNAHTASWTGTQFLAFSPGGQTLVSVASEDPFARRWDLVEGKELPHLATHRSWCGAVEFSANGRVLVTGSRDTTSLMWSGAAVARRAAAPTRPTSEALDRLWADIGHPDAAIGYRAVVALAAAGDRTTTMIADRLRPAAPIDSARIARLIDALNLPRFADRERATAALVLVADQAEDALRAALDRPQSAEIRHRVRRILESAREMDPSPDRLRELRAVEVLEDTATPAARAHLSALALGARGANLTRDARAALRRLE
jgi:WD40 repeat protein